MLECYRGCTRDWWQWDLILWLCLRCRVPQDSPPMQHRNYVQQHYGSTEDGAQVCPRNLGCDARSLS